MNAVLSKDNVIELLERAVEEKGADYVDPNAPNYVCEYADEEGNPLCIVGHVLSYLGEPLKPTEQEDFNGGLHMTLWGSEQDAREVILNPSAFGVDDYDVVGAVLGTAQRVQDRAGTWGEALEAAKNRLAESDRD